VVGLLVVDNKPETVETLEGSSTGGPDEKSNELADKDVVALDTVSGDWNLVTRSLNAT